MTHEEEIIRVGDWIAAHCQGSANMDGLGLNPEGYERLKIHARGIVRAKREKTVQELIAKWETSAQSLDAAAQMTDELKRSRYGNHFKRMDREKKRDFQRLEQDANELRNQAGVFRKCIDDIRKVISPPPQPYGSGLAKVLAGTPGSGTEVPG